MATKIVDFVSKIQQSQECCYTISTHSFLHRKIRTKPLHGSKFRLLMKSELLNA